MSEERVEWGVQYQIPHRMDWMQPIFSPYHHEAEAREQAEHLKQLKYIVRIVKRTIKEEVVQ